MSAATFVRTAVQFLAAVSPTDLMSCFTFSVAFAAAVRACSLRVSIFSCASFSAAATASSAFLARTDKSASCWESRLAMYLLHYRRTSAAPYDGADRLGMFTLWTPGLLGRNNGVRAAARVRLRLSDLHA